MKHSTGKPTQEEAARIKLIMGMSCAVCALHGDVSKRALELHHIVRGGKRMGHWYSIQLCRGHHQGRWDQRNPQPAQVAISDGMKAFRRAHGGLDDLAIWQRLQVILGMNDELPKSKIVPRRLPAALPEAKYFNQETENT
jgi:hypothetical protein